VCAARPPCGIPGDAERLVMRHGSTLDELDAALTERWAHQFCAGEVGEARQAFAAKRARGPQLTWRPRSDELAFPQLMVLHDFWARLGDGAAPPNVRAVDPFAIRGALGYVNLIDIVEGGRDFRTRLYGSIIARVSSFDLTGTLISAAPMQPYMRAFHTACYRAAMARREPLVTRHGAPDAETTAEWHRLILPLVDDAGIIVRFLVGNLPVGFNGNVIRTGW
jgi:hypothetical protein